MPHLTLSWVPHRVAPGYRVAPLVNLWGTPLYQNSTQPSVLLRDSLTPMTKLLHEPPGSGPDQMCRSEPSGEMSWKCSAPSPSVRSTNGPTLSPPSGTPDTCIWNSATHAPDCVGIGFHRDRQPR